MTDNAKYIRPGAELVVQHNPDWSCEVKQVNCGKEGAPFQYADTMIMMIAALRTALGVPFRQLSGMADKMLEGHDSPHYTTLCRRMKKLDINIRGNTIYVHDAFWHITLMADATGLKQWNRGEWIRDKWKVVRKGYVKMHLLADADTGMMLAAVVTDDRTGDSPVLRDLPDQAAAEPFAKTEKDDTREAKHACRRRLSACRFGRRQRRRGRRGRCAGCQPACRRRVRLQEKHECVQEEGHRTACAPPPNRTLLRAAWAMTARRGAGP